MARPTYLATLLALLAILFFMTPAATTTAAARPAVERLGTGEHATGRLLVKFRPSAHRAEVASLRLQTAARTTRTIRQIGLEVLTVPEDRLNAVLELLQAHPAVEYASLDYTIRATSGPNDPYFVDGTQWAPQKIEAPAAWGMATGSGVIIAVVDTGVDPNHPDLQARLVPGYNFYNNNSNTADGCGHGTHLAGVAAATANNATGVAGIAHGSQIMPIKVMSDWCSGNYSSLIDGIIYAADQGARVITISSGASYYSGPLRDAVVYARNHGAIVVAAAGNGNESDPFYPAAYAEALAVAGTDRYDGRYTNSNYGSWIDLAAPAQSIFSTYWHETTNSSYVYMSGTSDAAPHVAGLAALLLSLDPSLTVSEVESLIASTADDLGASGWDAYFGHGRINAYQALLAAGGVPPTPTSHIGDIDGAFAERVGRNRWRAMVSLSVLDGEQTPIAGATVDGNWNGGYLGSAACTTDASGRCTIYSGVIAAYSDSTTFTVTGITHDSFPYDPAANEDPDGDSDGTSIIIAFSEPPLPPGGATLSIADLDGSSAARPGGKWRVTLTITVRDANNNPVTGAGVTGLWSGAYAATAICTTGANGQCTHTTGDILSGSGDATFTVSDISHSGFTYNPSDNGDPDGDSNGTQITIGSP